MNSCIACKGTGLQAPTWFHSVQSLNIIKVVGAILSYQPELDLHKSGLIKVRQTVP